MAKTKKIKLTQTEILTLTKIKMELYNMLFMEEMKFENRQILYPVYTKLEKLGELNENNRD